MTLEQISHYLYRYRDELNKIPHLLVKRNIEGSQEFPLIKYEDQNDDFIGSACLGLADKSKINLNDFLMKDWVLVLKNNNGYINMIDIDE